MSHVHVPDEAIPRRGFLKVAIGLLNTGIALLLAVPGLGYLLTPVFRRANQAWVRLGPAANFTGSTPRKAEFSYVSTAGYSQTEKKGFVWVSHDSENEQPTVFSPVCSHTGCNVAWHNSEQKFVCPCHGGRYDIHGQVVSGPPPEPLTELPVRIENGELLIQHS